MTKTETRTKTNATLIMRIAALYSHTKIYKSDRTEFARICEELKKRGIITEQEIEEMTRFFEGI